VADGSARGRAALIASAFGVRGGRQRADRGDRLRVAFGLALPLLRLPGGRSGSCALVVDLGGPDDPEPTQVVARFEADGS